MSSCKHDCEKPAVFPLEISNRPALTSIDYRIGTYSRMREHMIDQLNKSAVLSAWTHRGADDPGIAILEGAAIVGDILTYYQERYANEAFLRTAEWRESVSELVQMLGYRLAPGVGGEATFAVKVKGETPVVVPKGFGFKAQLEGRDVTDEFESSNEITAYPHLGEFNLYRPPLGPQAITAGGNQLELKAVGGQEDLTSLLAQEINEGDRIMLVPDSTMFDQNGTSYSPQGKTEILIVSKVETVLNRVVITFEGALTADHDTTVRAYIINRTFRHFGHNAPIKLNVFDGSSVTQENTEFDRKLDGTGTGSDYYSTYTELEMPLDQEIDDLALGGKLICQGIAAFNDTAVGSTSLEDVMFTVVKEIDDVRADSLVWGNYSGSTTVVTLKTKLMTNDSIVSPKMDLRQARFHEVISPELTLGAPTAWTDGAFTDGQLQFFGRYDQARTLAGRDLLLVDHDNAVVQAVRVNDTVDDFSAALAAGNKDEDNLWLWDISLDQEPVFNREDFDQLEPGIMVYGNLVAATQGKTEQEIVLGNGDNRQSFQTFAIPKAPLTYLMDESQSPAQVPELQIYVDGILWQRVDNFFDSKSDDQVYVVREDNDGNSWVQFGNNKTGSRLPSGINNVVAVYRTGIGANGVLETDKKAQGVGKLKQLEDVFLPGTVVGGAEAEDENLAREAAPGKMQSLGRLVGLADFEAEALALPGVIKVRADWVAPNGVPLVRIVVLTESGTTAALAKVRDSLRTYNRCRGSVRFPVLVVQGNYQYLYLKVRAAYAATYRQQDIESAINTALGVTGEEGNGAINDQGLFALGVRAFGQSAHASQILAAIQQVEGVAWVEIDAAQALDLGTPVETDPGQLAIPAVTVNEPVISCPSERVLALYTMHFDLSLVQLESKQECGT